MKSKIIKAELATIQQLFEYKKSGFTLIPFPGYSDDQWGIKAHNRPWIETAFSWQSGQNVMEVGGAFSTFPSMLAKKYHVNSWISDDFGEAEETTDMWQRWGNPKLLPEKYPEVKYVFHRMGDFSQELPSESFDCIFSISTLEHIPEEFRIPVLKDIDRCLKPGGIQLHTIDISFNYNRKRWFKQCIREKAEQLGIVSKRCDDDLNKWLRDFQEVGYELDCPYPRTSDLVDRRFLVESADVVYRFYPPNNEPKDYSPSASLLIVLKKN